jgi:quercetin dioxygenase-like cupin family protein
MPDEATWIEDLTLLLPNVSPDTIVSRTIFSGPGLRATLFGFAAGQELSEHTAAVPAVLHFLRGRARLMLGDRPATASAGTWVYLPARMPHSVAADEPVEMLLLLLQPEPSG